MKFDKYEWHILQVLQKDGRLTNQEIADKVGLSPTPCWRRVNVLNRSGVIKRYAAILDPKVVGIGEVVFAEVLINKQDEQTVQEFEATILQRPEVLECYASMGEADYLLKLAIPSVSAYDQFLQKVIFKLPCVVNVRSNLALRVIKQDTALPLELYSARMEN